MATNEIGATVEQLESMLRREERQLESVQQRIRAIRSAIDVLTPHNKPSDESAVHRPMKQRIHKKSVAHLVRSKTAEILLAKGQPMSRSEILAQLEKRGVKINSLEPEKRLSKILWDAGEFQNGGNGYWFAGGTPLKGTSGSP